MCDDVCCWFSISCIPAQIRRERHFPNGDWYLVLPQTWPSLCLRTLHCLSFQMKMDLDLSWLGSDAAWLLFRFFLSNGQWSWFRTKKLLLRNVSMIVAYWSRSCEEGPGSLKYFVWTRHNPYSTTCRIGTLQKRIHYFGRINGTLTMMAWKNPMKIQNHINTWYKKPSWQVVTLAVMWFRRVSNTAWKHPMVGSRKMEVGWFWN